MWLEVVWYFIFFYDEFILVLLGILLLVWIWVGFGWVGFGVGDEVVVGGGDWVLVVVLGVGDVVFFLVIVVVLLMIDRWGGVGKKVNSSFRIKFFCLCGRWWGWFCENFIGC